MPALNKHLEKADRFVQKGKFEAALDELLIARNEEPGNDEIVLAQADVYLRLNRARECRNCYGILFDKYAAKGESPKALEYFHKMRQLGPPEPKRLIACAHLIEKQSPNEAIEYYSKALETLPPQDSETELHCLQSLSALRPSSLDVHHRLAALAARLNKTPLAFAAYTKLGELLNAEKRPDEAVEAFEKAYGFAPQSAPAKLLLGKACAVAKRYPRILELFEAEAQSDDAEILGLLVDAYVAENLLAKAEPVCWKLAKTRPEAFDVLIDISIDYMQKGNIDVALPMMKRLEQQLIVNKQQRRLIALAHKLGTVETTNLFVLEYLARLSDQLNLDGPLAKALHSLFDLYYAAGEFHKATNALERLIDVDPYAPECSVKLQQLEGKGDQATWKELASRLGKTSTTGESFSSSPAAQPERPAPSGEPDPGGGNTLRDLILQAEIFLQYNLQDKARERLERIAKLFPGEEEKNEELRALFGKANFAVGRTSSTAGGRASETPDWSRISELIRNLSRQGTVKGVLSAAVNDIGRLWQASRCLIGLATPKRPPTMALEYISPGIAPSDPATLAKLVMGLQPLVEEKSAPLVIDNVAATQSLTAMEATLAALKVQSLLAIPLREEGQAAGLLVLEQCAAKRSWQTGDVAALETVAEQIVLAVSNARLRSLMKALAVADERSGLLHRESYLTCLLSESERMKLQKKPLTAAIIEFSSGAPEGEDQSLDEFVRQFATTFASHLRQSDIALKYSTYSLAAIMPSTTGREAIFMVEKMRKLAASYSSTGVAFAMAAGVAEVMREPDMDGADAVTELINRLEAALAEARANGGNATKLLEPTAIPR